MAGSVTTITTTKTLATCGAVLLTGPAKIVAEGMVEADRVTIYEETATEGNYQAVPESAQRVVVLRKSMPSFIFEGYGNYKFLLGDDTAVGLKVGYVAG